MADEYAWKDREMMISLFRNLQRCIDDFKKFAKEVEKFKLGVLDHPARLAELKKLIDEDPNWTLDDIRAKYDEFKAVYDYLTT
ncbi:unnamed protein product [marine sediment metagenome]|uniref:Uncharacterized protein n=1 Tax=marine sediment metagenome TaxID=412755 RepID=X1FRA9_9ZZZZ